MSYYQFNRKEVCQKKKKKRLKSTKEKDRSNWFTTQKKRCKINDFFLLNIRMSEKTLKFDNIRLIKKDAINLNN